MFSVVWQPCGNHSRKNNIKHWSNHRCINEPTSQAQVATNETINQPSLIISYNNILDEHEQQPFGNFEVQRLLCFYIAMICFWLFAFSGLVPLSRLFFCSFVFVCCCSCCCCSLLCAVAVHCCCCCSLLFALIAMYQHCSSWLCSVVHCYCSLLLLFIVIV